jgi:hypothetical protein
VRPEDRRTLALMLEATARSGLPVAAHLTLLPHLGETVETGAGHVFRLDETPVAFSAEELGGSVRHAGYRLRLPETASLHWPALPHNPYRKDGRATAAEGRIEIRIPFDRAHPKHEIILEAGDASRGTSRTTTQ